MARAAALLAALVLAACGERAEAPPSPATAPAAPDPQAMQVVGFDGWQQALGANRGSVVVVDLWASWCVTCIERFPAMVTMSQRYRDKGVRFLSLNLDDREDAAAIEWSQKFLRGLGAGIAHYRLDENLMQAFERLDLLGIPVVLVYDRSGAEAARLTGDDPNNQFDEDDVEQAIQGLLAK